MGEKQIDNSKLSEEDRKLIEEFERECIEREKSDRKNVEEGKMCANCHAYLYGLFGENWKYCPFCGTKKGEEKFNSSRNDSILMYGPEYLCFYKCKNCGFKWSVDVMHTGIDGDEPQYCPNCGIEKIKMYYEEQEDMMESLWHFKRSLH